MPAILLVEDDALIRMMMAEMLEDLGHRVTAEAHTVGEALSLAETASYDLALLDVNVHGQVITPVAQAVASRGLPFVFVSGYSDSAKPPQFRGAPLLQKPFSAADLDAAIGAVLGARPAALVGAWRATRARDLRRASLGLPLFVGATGRSPSGGRDLADVRSRIPKKPEAPDFGLDENGELADLPYDGATMAVIQIDRVFHDLTSTGKLP